MQPLARQNRTIVGDRRESNSSQMTIMHVRSFLRCRQYRGLGFQSVRANIMMEKVQPAASGRPDRGNWARAMCELEALRGREQADAVEKKGRADSTNGPTMNWWIVVPVGP
jgi:hypothetical protein